MCRSVNLWRCDKQEDLRAWHNTMRKKTPRKPAVVKDRTAQSAQGRRLRWLLFFMCLVIGIVVWRLFVLQVMYSSRYTKQAMNQRSALAELYPDRGDVFLQDEGNALYPLAINRPYFTVSIVPKEIIDPTAVEKLLSDVLQKDPAEIAAKIARTDDPYELIERKLSDEAVSKIQAAGLKGVHLDKENYRFYPAETMASQVVRGWPINVT